MAPTSPFYKLASSTGAGTATLTSTEASAEEPHQHLGRQSITLTFLRWRAREEGVL